MRRHESGVERGVALNGDTARHWLQTRGWRTTVRNPQVFGDVFDAARFAFSRMWLGPGRYVRGSGAPGVAGDRVSALLLVEGAAELTLDDRASAFGVGDLVVVGSTSTVEISAQAPVALYETVTDYTRIGLKRYGLAPTSGPHATSPDYWPALTGVINQVFASAMTPDDRGMGSVRTAIDSLLLASLKQSTAMAESRQAVREHALLERARRVIHEEAHSVALTVAQLSERVRVSRAHLHRLFAAEASTPLAEIRAARVELARLYLAEADHTAELDLLDVAHRSGFPSVAAMRKAVRRD